MDILDMVDTAAGEISDEDLDEEVIEEEVIQEETLLPQEQKTLHDMVEENSKILGTMAPLEPSAFVLEDLKLKHPQVSN